MKGKCVLFLPQEWLGGMHPCPVLVLKLDPSMLDRAKKTIRDTLQLHLQGPLDHYKTYSE